MLLVWALAMYVVSLVEVTPAFVPATAGGSLRGSGVGHNFGRAAEHSVPLASRSGLQAISTMLILSACALAARDIRRGRATRACVQMKAKAMQGDMWVDTVESPTTVYMRVLQEAATKQGEAVQVSKDCMKVKNMFKSQEYIDGLELLINDPFIDVLGQADVIIGNMGGLESTVMPKFIKFLAKKRRMMAIKAITEEYVKDLYESNGVVPVTVTSAAPLSEEQTDALKEKMKLKTGAQDIKLITIEDRELLGGFKIEWAYEDPQNRKVPQQGMDFSLKGMLLEAALAKGVITTGVDSA